MIYKIAQRGNGILRINGANESFIPAVDTNIDWQAYQMWLAAGNVPEPADEPVSAVRMISKLVATDRIIAAGKIEVAMAALNANPVALFRWNAAQEIASNDADVRAFLTAIGTDPDEILA